MLKSRAMEVKKIQNVLEENGFKITDSENIFGRFHIYAEANGDKVAIRFTKDGEVHSIQIYSGYQTKANEYAVMIAREVCKKNKTLKEMLESYNKTYTLMKQFGI